MGIERNRNPAVDMTGEHAMLNQREEILFLCQTFESTQIVPKRKLTVPSGTAIFMPIINYLSTIPEDGRNEDEIISTAVKKMNSIRIISLSINLINLNIRADEFRFRSDVFQVVVPPRNLLGLDSGIITCVSDGYWIMFEPIKSPISISSTASCSSGKTRISVEYSIELLHQAETSK